MSITPNPEQESPLPDDGTRPERPIPVLSDDELKWHKNLFTLITTADQDTLKAKCAYFDALLKLDESKKAMNSWCAHLTTKYGLGPADLIDANGNIFLR